MEIKQKDAQILFEHRGYLFIAREVSFGGGTPARTLRTGDQEIRTDVYWPEEYSLEQWGETYAETWLRGKDGK